MVGKGSTPQAALKASISLAQRAENLGFARYWLAEHHGVPAVASSAPVVSIGALAAATNRIRVGSGGVMLPNHVPLIVAEQFGTLEALYPGRIDLGFGRARPNARITSVLSRYLTRYGIDDFQEQITELVGFLTGNFPTDHPYSELIVSPQSEKPPTMWMLGASVQSADLAASLGLPFAFGHHFGRGDAATVFEHYRRAFRPSIFLRKPYTMVTALVVCAPTDIEADMIARSAELMFMRLSHGEPDKLPSPEETAIHRWTSGELDFIQQLRRGQAIGSPETIRSNLTQLLEVTKADELMMAIQMYRPEDSVRSIELVSEIFKSPLA
jgi:luciferase family oxidoreductase group 1